MSAIFNALHEPDAADLTQSTEPVMARAKVLLVDDDERNLLALSEVVEDIADVVLARSGEEALRCLLKERFSVIILDVLMPGIDGYETAKLIRARAQSRDTPIIFLTAINKEDAHLLRGYDSGAVDFVFKPFEPMILRSKVSVFVTLHEKSMEIERTALRERQLLQDRLEAQQERVRAVEALRESEERLDLVLRSLPMAVYTEDVSTSGPRFVGGNVAAITGFEGADFLSDTTLWQSRLHPEDLDHFALSPGAEGRSGEFRWRHSDDSYRYFLDQAVVLADRGGLVAGTLRDVTEQRHMQDQLLQVQKLDAVGKLTGGIAHDFNNLLASVLSGLSLIQRRADLSGNALEVLNMTTHAAEQGKNLVSRLLAFSRRQNLAPRVVELGTVSQTLHAMLAPILGGIIHLKWEIEPELWPTYVDPSQLELAMMNLVINARDAMPNGGTITIRLCNRTSPVAEDLAAGEFVTVTVCDTGTGIPAPLMSKVIEPFFTTKEVGKGTGLGLSMAYGFANQSGGTLRIESVVGKGTDVEIWLPRSHQINSSAPDDFADGPARISPKRQAHILLVDDSATLRRLTEMQLVEEGYDVTSAAGGAEALALIERDQQSFDIIVTDFAMPLMTGLDVIRFARTVRSTWPAVIITGFADAAAVAERPDDVAVVTKPFGLQNLVQAIELSLSNEK
jgi:signal transduction histidine kinase